MHYLIAVVFAGILVSLGLALLFMLRGGREGVDESIRSRRMARALTLRITLSVLLFLVLLLAWKLGYIHPHGLPMGT